MHFFKPEHIDDLCPNCLSASKGDWKPEFHDDVHYMTKVCDCGYKLFKRTEFMSSGHY